jgi:hypothetical protein
MMASSAPARRLAPAVLDPLRWRALALLCGAFFMVLLDGTITIVALPSIGADLGFAKQDLPWVLSVYALTFGGLLLLGGRWPSCSPALCRGRCGSHRKNCTDSSRPPSAQAASTARSRTGRPPDWPSARFTASIIGWAGR